MTPQDIPPANVPKFQEFMISFISTNPLLIKETSQEYLPWLSAHITEAQSLVDDLEEKLLIVKAVLNWLVNWKEAIEATKAGRR